MTDLIKRLADALEYEAFREDSWLADEVLAEARAFLAQQQGPTDTPPQPVPVAERLPGPSDFHPDKDWCWGWYSWRWRMMDSSCFSPDSEAVYWLPYYALPIPHD